MTDVDTGCMIKTNYSKSVAGANEDKTRKTNQDSYICKTNLLNMKNFSLFSVLDGHGKYFILL
jgi:serine/threonine protein phosphatase PrpC